MNDITRAYRRIGRVPNGEERWTRTEEVGAVTRIGPGFADLRFPNNPKVVRVKLAKSGKIDSRIAYHGYRYFGQVEQG